MSNVLSVTGQLSLIQSTGGQPQGVFQFPVLTSNVNAYTSDLISVGTVTATVALPLATVTSVLVYNGGVGTLNVNWTPAGASIINVIVLQPLSQIMLSNGAITALTLIASVAATPATVVLAG